MILEAYELGVIRDKKPQEVKNFLKFLGLDSSYFELDNLELAKTIDKEIKSQINASYSELWREVLELARVIDSSIDNANDATIKFILDNKDKLSTDTKSNHIGSMAVLPIMAASSLLLLPAIAYCNATETNKGSYSSGMLIATAAIVVAVAFLVLRRKKKSEPIVDEESVQLNKKRFVEILEEVYKLRLILGY